MLLAQLRILSPLRLPFRHGACIADSISAALRLPYRTLGKPAAPPGGANPLEACNVAHQLRVFTEPAFGSIRVGWRPPATAGSASVKPSRQEIEDVLN